MNILITICIHYSVLWKLVNDTTLNYHCLCATISSRRHKTELSFWRFRNNCLNSETFFVSILFSSFNFWTSPLWTHPSSLRVTGMDFTGRLSSDTSRLIIFRCWLPGTWLADGVWVRTLVAGGRFWGIKTVASSVDVQARSQNTVLPDFS